MTLDDRDMPEPADVEAVKAFCAALGDDGFLTPHWPKAWAWSARCC